MFLIHSIPKHFLFRLTVTLMPEFRARAYSIVLAVLAVRVRPSRRPQSQ